MFHQIPTSNVSVKEPIVSILTADELIVEQL